MKNDVLCAWCEKVIREDGEVANSHGICQKCLEIERQKLREWKKTKNRG